MTMVVVINDDPALPRMIAEVLTLEGYRVRTALDGQAGLPLLHQLPCRAVVLLDDLMPPPDGPGVLKALEADPAWRARFAVLWMSAGVHLKAFAARSGLKADGALALPFNVDQLLAAVQSGEAVLAARPREVYENAYAYLRVV